MDKRNLDTAHVDYIRHHLPNYLQELGEIDYPSIRSIEKTGFGRQPTGLNLQEEIIINPLVEQRETKENISLPNTKPSIIDEIIHKLPIPEDKINQVKDKIEGVKKGINDILDKVIKDNIPTNPQENKLPENSENSTIKVFFYVIIAIVLFRFIGKIFK